MKEQIGSSFTKSFKIVGFLIIAIGLLISLSNILYEFSFAFLIGIPLILVGLILNLTFYGIEIKNNKYRKFTKVLGITLGKFKNINDYVFISIKKAEHGQKVYGASNMSVSVSDKKYDVCFFDKTYRKMEVMKICDTEKEAIEFAKVLTTETGLEYTKYNPPISDATMNRRNKKN